MSAELSPIDLRSDTVTQPTREMKQAMWDAPLGDDVLGDDPTVQRLEEHVAKLLGKEAALFVPSGTMANQLAIRSHTESGDEIILEAESHAFLFETGALAAISGVQTQLLPGKQGLLHPKQVEKAIRSSDYHFPPSRLIILENTHNQGGGTVYPLERVQAIRDVAQKHRLKLHIDGARLWNACIAANLEPSQYAAAADSVSVCLSKGLGAPVGSVLTGETRFILRARRFRKMFGGGMRQSGLLAAAGLYALEHHYARLAEDHANAKYLADALSGMPHIRIRPNEVETNILYFGVRGRSPQWVEAELEKKGVRLFAERPEDVRAVTHLGVSREQIDIAAQQIASLES